MRIKILVLISFAVLALAEAAVGGEAPAAETAADAVSAPKKKLWSGLFDLSAAVNGGNTEISLLAVRLKAERKSSPTRMIIEGSYDYGEENEANNIRKAMLKDRIEWSQTRVHPWSEAKGEHDLFGGIDLRLTLTSGAGMQVVKRENTELSIRLGVGYVNENAVIAADDKESFLITAGLDYSRQFKPAASFEFKLLWENELGPWRIKAEMGFRYSLNENLSFRVSVVEAYDSSPPTGKLSNDYSVLVGLGYSF